MRSVRAKAVLLLLGGLLALGLVWAIEARSSEAQQGAMYNCPQADKWAISVWTGPDDVDTQTALVTCPDTAVAAAYWLDPATQKWLRYFEGRTDISDLLTLDNMQGIIVLGGAAAPTPSPTPSPTPTLG